MRGLFGHQVPIAVLAFAPADDLAHVLAGILPQQLFVSGHASGGQDDRLGVDVHHVAVGVGVLDARDGVLVIGQQGGRARFRADVDAFFLSDGRQRGDAGRPVAAFVEIGAAGIVVSHAMEGEQPVGVVARFAQALGVQHGVGYVAGPARRLHALEARFVFGRVGCRAVALRVVRRPA